MEAVTVSSTYRIVIPKEIRKQFNLKPGYKLMFIPRDSTLEVVIIPSIKEGQESLKRIETVRAHEKTKKRP